MASQKTQLSVARHRYLSVKQLKKKSYQTLELSERFRKMFGTLQTKFIAMAYGASGGGKSVFVLQLSEELAKHGRVLYNSHEEADNMTLQDRVNNFNINSGRITFAVSVPFEAMCEKIMKGRYSFVVIDSVQYMAFTYDQLQQLRELGKRKKKFGIIMVSFGKSKDNPTKATDHLHASDVKMYFQKGTVTTESRYLDRVTKTVLYSHSNQPTLFAQS